jgi:predicted metal-dependent phosphoesterase TrpH
VGLDGLVITEHHYQWTEDELAELREQSGVLGFLLLAGFEYTSSQGDILIYGLNASQATEFPPGHSPEEVVAWARSLGAACVAAHPTRGSMSFDERIFEIPFAAIEVSSIHLREHEQRLAQQLADSAGVPGIAASDAHALDEVGLYKSDFDDAIHSMADLQQALLHGRFRPADIGTEKV